MQLEHRTRNGKWKDESACTNALHAVQEDDEDLPEDAESDDVAAALGEDEEEGNLQSAGSAAAMHGFEATRARLLATREARSALALQGNDQQHGIDIAADQQRETDTAAERAEVCKLSGLVLCYSLFAPAEFHPCVTSGNDAYCIPYPSHTWSLVQRREDSLLAIPTLACTHDLQGFMLQGSPSPHSPAGKLLGGSYRWSGCWRSTMHWTRKML